MENENSHEIKHFLEWYIRKNIGGIINLTLENEKTVKDNLPSEYDRFIFELLKGEYLSKNIELTDNERQIILDKKKLYVAECYATQGPTLKRIRPRAQGRAFRIMKKTSHVTMVLKEMQD